MHGKLRLRGRIRSSSQSINDTLRASLYNNSGEREEVHFLAFDVAIFTGQYWSNFQTIFLTPVS